MPKYGVEIPFSGSYYVVVNVPNADEAIVEALKHNPFKENDDAEVTEIQYTDKLNEPVLDVAQVYEVVEPKERKNVK